MASTHTQHADIPKPGMDDYCFCIDGCSCTRYRLRSIYNYGDRHCTCNHHVDIHRLLPPTNAREYRNKIDDLERLIPNLEERSRSALGKAFKHEKKVQKAHKKVDESQRQIPVLGCGLGSALSKAEKHEKKAQKLQERVDRARKHLEQTNGIFKYLMPEGRCTNWGDCWCLKFVPSLTSRPQFKCASCGHLAHYHLRQPREITDKEEKEKKEKRRQRMIKIGDFLRWIFGIEDRSDWSEQDRVEYYEEKSRRRRGL